MMPKYSKAFTLLEVLIALAIISIALTALLLVMSQSIQGTERVKNKTLSHLVAMQGLAMVQLKLTPVQKTQTKTEKLIIFGNTWFWQAKSSATSLPNMQRIEITVSQHASGPFTDPLVGYGGF
ncbi:MAG: type II secretion system minor pseudopilin GspI [Legionellaceae bacterium]|nr:type II secretion system minor pseudopilin GspI [Legionellaceae bacterium]